MNKLGRVLALFLTGLFCSSNAMDLRRITFQDGKGGFHEVEKGSFVLNMIAHHSTLVREYWLISPIMIHCHCLLPMLNTDCLREI